MKLLCACEVHVVGGGSVLLREVRTLLREIEKKSKGNPIGHLLELKGNLKELHLEQQPAASSRQQAASSQQPAQHTFTMTTQLHQDNINSDFKNNAAEGRVIKYFTSTAQLHAMLVKYVITRPSAALFLNHIFALSLCGSVVRVEVFL